MVSFAKIALLSLAVFNQANGLALGSIFRSNSAKTNTLPGDKPVPGDSPIAVCDSALPQLLELQEVSLSPNPPVRGENLTISAIGFLTEAIEEGAYVDVEVKYGYIKLVHQTFDLCEQMGNVDLTCPLARGEHIITKEVEIPDQVPPGKYVVFARAYTKDDEFITCITATVEFPPLGYFPF